MKGDGTGLGDKEIGQGFLHGQGVQSILNIFQVLVVAPSHAA